MARDARYPHRNQRTEKSGQTGERVDMPQEGYVPGRSASGRAEMENTVFRPGSIVLRSVSGFTRQATAYPTTPPDMDRIASRAGQGFDMPSLRLRCRWS